MQQIISYNQTLLPTDNVTATSEHSSFNPDKYLFHRNNIPVRLWCTLPDAGLEHHINATFTEPVVITGLVSSGFSNGYVNNFTVGFSMHKGEGFTLYQDEHIERVCLSTQLGNLYIHALCTVLLNVYCSLSLYRTLLYHTLTQYLGCRLPLQLCSSTSPSMVVWLPLATASAGISQ